MKRLVPYLLLVLIISSACSSGKKAYQKGDYEKSVFNSINRLRKSPNNDKAKATLKEAYPQLVGYYQDRIKSYKLSNDVHKWEKVIVDYGVLNQAYNEILRSPGALKVIPNPKNFQAEEDEARRKGAEARFVLGERELAAQDRERAKVAFAHFEKAEQLMPNFRGGEARTKMEEARIAATLHVLIEPIPMHSRALELSNEFFESQIIEYVRGTTLNPFVQFYTVEEQRSLGIPTDHVVRMQFDDFVVGQAYVKEEVTQCSRDSIIVGQVNITADSVADVYGTVTAKLHNFSKTLTSSGLLDVKLIDARTNSIISQQKFPGTFVWESRWGFFNGDERALTAAELKITKQRELPNPLPQDLFIEFTRPIYNQVTSHLKRFYRSI